MSTKKKMILSRKPLIFLVSSLFIICYIIADCIFREIAFRNSNEFVIRLQAKLSSQFFEVFFIIFCDILYPIIAAALLILYYALTFQKVKTLAFIIYFILITYSCSVLKILYHDPRPYWENSAVEAKECYSEFGNPSGHSMMSIVMIGMIWMRYLWALVKYGEVGFLNGFFLKNKKEKNEENDIPLVLSQENEYDTEDIVNNNNNNVSLEINDKKEQKQTPYKSKGVAFVVFTIMLILIEFFILFGRIFLGMHSYNEVLLGFLFGIYFLIVYYLYIERLLMILIETIIIRKYRLFMKGSFLDWKVLCLITFSYLTFLIFPIILYEIYDQTLIFPQNWIDNIKKSCPDNTVLKMLLKKCFIDCGVIGTVFGILYGIFFTKGEYYCLKLVYSINKNPHYLFPNQTSFKKHIARVIIVVIFAGIWAGVFAIIPNANSVYFCYFINNQIATFVSGFLLIKLVPFMNNKLKVECEKDFLKYNNGDFIIHAHNSIGYEEVIKS